MIRRAHNEKNNIIQYYTLLYTFILSLVFFHPPPPRILNQISFCVNIILKKTTIFPKCYSKGPLVVLRFGHNWGARALVRHHLRVCTQYTVAVF